MSGRINNPESCICCSRRADGVAVGKPGKLGWYCLECGPDMAKIAVEMNERMFDGVELRAIESVVNDAAGSEPVTIAPDEMHELVKWIIRAYAERMRNLIENGGAPF